MYDCNRELIFPTTDGKSQSGKIAHIEALNEGGARFNPNLSLQQRNSEDNLILVCADCHDKIDSDPKKYTVEYLKEMKRNHIRKMKLVRENANVNFNFDDLYFASRNIIDDELILDGFTNEETFENYDIPEIEYKMSKNDLSSITSSNIIDGVVQQPLVKKFFVEMSKEDDLFFEKVKISLKNCYDTLKYEYKGDFLFLGIYDNFKKGLNINQQSACLGIIVYFFTICELFEK